MKNMRNEGPVAGNVKPHSSPVAARALMFLVAILFSMLALGEGFPQTASEADLKPKLDVPYEPSSEAVVQLMLELAQVGPGDLVYDLGCGDGRIVIGAARKVGARGVGVDLDPQRIQESLENSRKAGTEDRVEFRRQDLFQTDIRPATVVMLYLYPEVNLKLRPKLFRELKPGTRVVSHSHSMGRWEADRAVIAPGGHTLHFWVMPANVAGIWEWTLPAGPERLVLKLGQKFQKVSGTLSSGAGEIPLKNVELRGDLLRFTVERVVRGRAETRAFSARVHGNIMELSEGEKGGDSGKAARDPASMKPLDVE